MKITELNIEALKEALHRLLQCPDLNLDELEPETRAAIQQAEAALSNCGN